MKGWHAALLALPLWIAPPAGAADDLQSAARELAKKTAVAAGRDPVAVSWRNVSGLGPVAVAQARAAFEAALREAGSRIGEAAAEAQVIVSENASAYLLVEDFKRGEERQVWIASWNRSDGGSAVPAAVVEKRLLWADDDPILDAAILREGLLVLTPSAIIRTAPRQSAPLAISRLLPRDPRGRLRVNGTAFQAHLPGVACSGTLEPLTVACKPSDEPWTLESGRAVLLATFALTRNYFDGRVLTPSGARKTIAPFYAAAPADAFWILTGLDGRAAVFDAALEPVAAAGAWGSDVAASDARCGGSPVVLATRPGDGPDSIQAYTVVNRAAVAAGAPVEMPGPVTALWAPGTAVVRNGAAYQAYAITVSCAP